MPTPEEELLFAIFGEQPERTFDEWCVCELDPGHGPTPHRCRCGNTWGIGIASPEHEPQDAGTP